MLVIYAFLSTFLALTATNQGGSEVNISPEIWQGTAGLITHIKEHLTGMARFDREHNSSVLG